MTSDPWHKKPMHSDWSVEVEEQLKLGPLPQDTSASAFPTLEEAPKVAAATARQGQGKRRQRGGQQKITLSEFISGDGAASSAFRPTQGRPLTNAEIMSSLPRAPREKDSNQPPPRSWGGRPGYGGRYEREDRRQRESEDEFVASRADQSQNWGADRRSAPRNYDRPASRGSERDGRDRDSDNWSRDNRFQPSSYQRHPDERQRRGYGFHSGGGGFGQRSEDRWSSRNSAPTPPPSDGSSQGRPRLMLSKRTKPLTETPQIATKTKNNPFGDARPREDVLKERGTSSDVYSSKSDIASEQEFRSQPGSPGGGSYRGSHVSGADKGEPRQKEDPFGGAKPREVVLSERISDSGSGNPDQ